MIDYLKNMTQEMEYLPVHCRNPSGPPSVVSSSIRKPWSCAATTAATNGPISSTASHHPSTNPENFSSKEFRAYQL